MRGLFTWPVRWQLVLLFLVIILLGLLSAWRVHRFSLNLDNASVELVERQLRAIDGVHRLQLEVLAVEKQLAVLRYVGFSPLVSKSVAEARARIAELVASQGLEHYSSDLVQALKLGGSRVEELLLTVGESAPLPGSVARAFQEVEASAGQINGLLNQLSSQLLERAGSHRDQVRLLSQRAMWVALLFNLILWGLVAAILYLLNLYGKEHGRTQRLTSFAKRHPDPVMACNLECEPDYANPAAFALCRLLGVDGPAALIENFQPQLQRMLEGHSELTEQEVEIGNRVLSVRMVLLRSLRQIQFHIKDISQARRVEKTMEHQVNHDFLTGLPNRRQFERDLRFWLGQRECELVVGMLHLDRFQRVTAAIGFENGDSVLRGAVEILRGLLNKEADPDAQLSLYRFESTRFALLWITPFQQRAVESLAARVQQGFRNPVVCVRTNRRFHLTLSQGFAATGTSDRNVDSLVRDADCAASRAVAEGGDRLCVHTREYGDRERRRVQLEQDLRYALERKQLQMYYQQQCDREGNIIAAEALLRWQHPELGMVPPDEFIDLAEQTGLILEIGDWVLEQACRQVCGWSREGGIAVVAVNISARQLMDDRFVDRVRAVLLRTGVEPGRVEFELTESMLMEDLERGRQVMGQLKKIGIRFAIDDFGTGYSSLAYLSQLPFDALKIDHSFVRRLPRDPYYCKVTKAVLSLAKTLGLTVVAEGVEYVEQQTWLVSHGCDLMQGYLHGKPVPVVEFGEMLDNGVIVH